MRREFVDKDYLLYKLGANLDDSAREIILSSPPDQTIVIGDANWKILFSPDGKNYQCSKCGYRVSYRSRFCPDCGSVMQNSAM